jgi:hypothetical protein
MGDFYSLFYIFVNKKDSFLVKGNCSAEVSCLKRIIEKKVPICIFCRYELKADHYVYLDGLNGIVHEACSQWERDFIKDQGTYEEIVAKYPLYFSKFKV